MAYSCNLTGDAPAYIIAHVHEDSLSNDVHTGTRTHEVFAPYAHQDQHRKPFRHTSTSQHCKTSATQKSSSNLLITVEYYLVESCGPEGEPQQHTQGENEPPPLRVVLVDSLRRNGPEQVADGRDHPARIHVLHIRGGSDPPIRVDVPFKARVISD